MKRGEQAWLVGTKSAGAAGVGEAGRFQQDTVGLLGESLIGNAKRVLLTFCGLVIREAWCSKVTANPRDYCVFLRDTLGVLLPRTRCAGIQA